MALFPAGPPPLHPHGGPLCPCTHSCSPSTARPRDSHWENTDQKMELVKDSFLDSKHVLGLSILVQG